jgi:DNA-binding transcriptional MocR family regulator
MTEDVVGIHDRLARRQQLPEEVAGYVRELIITGAVRPGEFLRMERIAEAVGVSNTPVREGLLILRSEGLVELVPRRLPDRDPGAARPVGERGTRPSGVSVLSCGAQASPGAVRFPAGASGHETSARFVSCFVYPKAGVRDGGRRGRDS